MCQPLCQMFCIRDLTANYPFRLVAVYLSRQCKVILSVLRSSPASPEEEKQNSEHQEDNDSSRPQEPSAFTAIPSHDHATRRKEKDHKENGDLFHVGLCISQIQSASDVYVADVIRLDQN